MADALLVTRTQPDDAPLEAVVDPAEETFAALEGHLLARSPEMKEPKWDKYATQRQ
jgi:hypothetical protein